jgi:DNA helicase HerA-like ATPase
MAEKIGTVFGEASTDSFSFIFSPSKLEKKGLKNAFVVVENESSGHKVVGRVVEIITDNPLLSPETTKFFVDDPVGSQVGDFLKSNRFMNYTARCEVLGEFEPESRALKPLNKPLESGASVYLIDRELLEELFFSPEPYNLFPGYIEQVEGARFSLDGDQIVTMHCGIFGMTGMGKTTTATTLLEELTSRGAKSLIFDPHGDYENLGLLRPELAEAVKELYQESRAFRAFVDALKNLLAKKWRELLKLVPHHFRGEVKEEITRELKLDGIGFRLLSLTSVLTGSVAPESKKQAKELLVALVNHYSFKEFVKKVPPRALFSLTKLRLKAFPSISAEHFYGKYFVMKLIEAYSGEEISEAQEGYYTRWLESEEVQGKRDEELLYYLLEKAEEIGDRSSSKWPIKRQIEKALSTFTSLREAGLVPVDGSEIFRAFSKRMKSESKKAYFGWILNLIFDLTEVSPETVQRALLYSIVYSGFNLHKSGELSVHRGDYPVLFVIEEARVLIPSYGAEEVDHPATRFARNAVRRVATEGRKMGLGLLIISQKPSSVDPLPVSQCNTLVLHRVVNPEDISFVKTVGESISQEELETLKGVERGVSIVTGTALKFRKSLIVRFRQRLSAEGRESPKPLRRLWLREF